MGNSQSGRKKGKKAKQEQAGSTSNAFGTPTSADVALAKRRAQRTEFGQYLSAMSEDDAERLKKLWIYKAKGERLNREQFITFFLQLHPGKNRDHVDMIFNAVDADGSDTVDLEEFLAFYALNKHGTQEDQLGAIFDALDLDGDGQLTKEELRRRIHQLVGFLHNGGKHPTAEEQVSIKSEVDRIIDPVFQALDADKSGGVSKKEFVQGFLKEDVLKQHWDSVKANLEGSEEEE